MRPTIKIIATAVFSTALIVAISPGTAEAQSGNCTISQIEYTPGALTVWCTNGASYYAFSSTSTSCNTISVDDLQAYLKIVLDAKDLGASVFFGAYTQMCVPGGLSMINYIFR